MSGASIVRTGTDARMSQAVVHGGVVYLAGQVDIERSSTTVAGQMTRILQRVDALLEAAGSSKASLLSATIWLTDLADFAEMNRVWTDWLPAGCAPARATVGAALALPGLRVEVAVIAATGTAGDPPFVSTPTPSPQP